jgi:hypothetical protein
VKEETHRTSTKETYESIEKSTPIKKLAQEEEEEEGEEERVQVDFNLKVRQVNIESDGEWK